MGRSNRGGDKGSDGIEATGGGSCGGMGCGALGDADFGGDVVRGEATLGRAASSFVERGEATLRGGDDGSCVGDGTEDALSTGAGERLRGLCDGGVGARLRRVGERSSSRLSCAVESSGGTIRPPRLPPSHLAGESGRSMGELPPSS